LPNQTHSFPRPTLSQRFTALAMSAFAGFMRAQQDMRASQFALRPPPPGAVVFVGDSITHGGLWDEWFPGARVLNRGIGGETTADVLRRIDAAINAPAAVFLLIGTNDLSKLSPLASIIGNIRKILSQMTARAPNAPVCVQSVMPRSAAFVRHVKALNEALRALVEELGGQVHYLDLWPALASPDGALRAEFTRDQLHLNGKGYQAWVEVLRPYVAQVCQQAGHLRDHI
jgi:lysophospholipase L1-like esterase